MLFYTTKIRFVCFILNFINYNSFTDVIDEMLRLRSRAKYNTKIITAFKLIVPLLKDPDKIKYCKLSFGNLIK